MRILVAPDSFKGSSTAMEAAGAMERGILRAYPAADVRACPLSDGGEGIAGVLLAASGGVTHPVTVTGPVGAPVTASWTMLDDGTAIIETATAIGLSLVPDARRSPIETTTAGVGELVRAALDAGAKRVVVGLGGSATTDGGVGMAQCLGVAFDAEMPFTGRRLKTIRAIDPSAREPRLAAAELIALTDVDNPLTGAEGAARIYGPQKGATEHDVLLLDAGLEHLTRIAGDPGRSPGDGAAGGLGYGLRVFTGARLAHGMDFVLERVGFDRQLDGCELVLTGEGRLDAQTARGKVVAGVAERARTRGIPVIALAGALSGDSYALHALGLTAAFSLCNRPMKESEAMANTAELLSALADQVVRLWAARR